MNVNDENITFIGKKLLERQNLCFFLHKGTKWVVRWDIVQFFINRGLPEYDHKTQTSFGCASMWAFFIKLHPNIIFRK